MLRLEDKGEDAGLAPEEKAYLELLTILVGEYERGRFSLETLATPLERLKHALEERNVTQAEVARALGSRSLASAVLNGKRGISRESARKLADLLRLPSDMFL
jgi:antitoxin component HigA of HigAB toxin-antitoxin module